MVEKLSEKNQALNLAVSSIEKQFGKGAIMRLGKDGTISGPIETICTGSVGLDLALGVG